MARLDLTKQKFTSYREANRFLVLNKLDTVDIEEVKTFSGKISYILLDDENDEKNGSDQ